MCVGKKDEVEGERLRDHRRVKRKISFERGGKLREGEMEGERTKEGVEGDTRERERGTVESGFAQLK